MAPGNRGDNIRYAASGNTVISLGNLMSMLEARFPAEWAEHWDKVGLVVGRPEQGGDVF